MCELIDLLDDARAFSGRYLETRDSGPVMPTEEALAALADLHGPLPETPTDPREVLAELDRLATPAAVATTGGRFFGFVVGGALPVTVAAGWLATAWDQNAGTWVLAPGAAELSGYFHDHLFVPWDRRDDAVAALLRTRSHASPITRSAGSRNCCRGTGSQGRQP